jgi:hypothetical protein
VPSSRMRAVVLEFLSSCWGDGMRPKVPPELRQEVSDLVRHFGEPPDWMTRFHSPYWVLPEGDLQGIMADSIHYKYQAVQLNRKSEAQYAAMFNDDGPLGEPLPVLVQVPDLSNFISSIVDL